MEKKKILFVTDNRAFVDTFWNEDAEKKCRQYGFTLDIPAASADFTPPDWPRLSENYDALVTTWGSPKITSGFLKNSPRVKIIGHCAGSVAMVTDETTYNAGVRVVTANPLMSRSVAEWSLLATLLAQRNFGIYASLGRKNPMNWAEHFNMGDIRCMTIGLWGLGDTARHLLKLLAPLEPGRILIASEHSSAADIAALGAEKVSLETLLHEADIFHCLVGVNDKTLYRLGDAEFSAMKNNAVFVNCGRARLCREEALIAALKSGRIRAVMDVFHQEPLPEDSPLYELDNVILTPHNAGFPGRGRYLLFLLDEFRRFFNGEALQSEITLSRYRTMTNETLR